MSSTRALRAVARLARTGLHVLHGAGIAAWRLPRLSTDERRATLRWWARRTLAGMGLGLELHGEPAGPGTLIVANHVSWLDIPALHAVCPEARFVSKADVRAWPLLSRLIDAGGTLYLERERKRDALRIVHEMAAALGRGEVLAVFPEGTTSDGRGVLPFHANLLQAAIAVGARVQPVALRYADRQHDRSRAVEFVGATTLLQSVWHVARGNGLVAHVAFLPARPAAGAGRRGLAQGLRDDILAALAAAPRPPAAEGQRSRSAGA